MYSDWVWQLLLGAVFVWSLGLSIIIWKERGFLRTLFPKSGDRDIRKKFEEVLGQVNSFSQKVNEQRLKIADLEKAGLGHIQKVKLLRYNPYEDVGGDQSFTVALLDKLGNGLVITSLHTRSGTRVFAKEVIEGKETKYEFSKEEAQAVMEALK